MDADAWWTDGVTNAGVAFADGLITPAAVGKRWTIPLLRSERQFSRFVLACVSLGFLALIGSAVAAGWTVVRAQDHARWVEHTYEVEQRISSLRVLVERSEASRRGYLLSHRPLAKQTFLETVAAEPGLIADVRRLTADNPVQQANITRVEQLVAPAAPGAGRLDRARRSRSSLRRSPASRPNRRSR